MKIGIFGDSFADKDNQQVWWTYLKERYPDITCFGECGSSLLFSATLIHRYINDFDHLIWCPTSVNRVSFRHREIYYHATGTSNNTHPDREINRKFDICHDFITEILDWHSYEIAGHALVHYFLDRYPNLSVLPSFSTPTYFMQPHGFNLYELCQRETAYYFGNKSMADVVDQYKDLRQGHLTDSTHRRLAKLVGENLDQKIIQLDYDDFATPTEPIGNVFRKYDL